MNIDEWNKIRKMFFKSRERYFDVMAKKNNIEELYTELSKRGAWTMGTRECYLLFEDDMFIIIPKCAVVFDGDTVVDMFMPWLIGICQENKRDDYVFNSRGGD